MFISVRMLLQEDFNIHVDEVRLTQGLPAKSDRFLHATEMVSLRQAKCRSVLD